jgi:hypothetical protein
MNIPMLIAKKSFRDVQFTLYVIPLAHFAIGLGKIEPRDGRRNCMNPIRRVSSTRRNIRLTGFDIFNIKFIEILFDVKKVTGFAESVHPLQSLL